jgi:hypothetical protein
LSFPYLLSFLPRSFTGLAHLSNFSQLLSLLSVCSPFSLLVLGRFPSIGLRIHLFPPDPCTHGADWILWKIFAINIAKPSSFPSLSDSAP